MSNGNPSPGPDRVRGRALAGNAPAARRARTETVPPMSASASLIVELEEAIERGDIKRRLTTLTRITDLFARRAHVYSEEQIALFDEVMVRLAADIETQARAELARRLAPVETAPAKIIRHLAHD